MDTFTKWLIIIVLCINTGMLWAITDRMIEWAVKDNSDAYEKGAVDMYKRIKESQGDA